MDAFDSDDDEWLNQVTADYEAYRALQVDGDFRSPEANVQRGGIIHDPLAGKVIIKPDGSRRSPK